jgi:hypothetical protein
MLPVYLIFTIVSAAFCLSCGGEYPENSRAITGNKERDLLKALKPGKSVELQSLSPAKFAELLHRADVPYMSGITHFAGDASRYISRRSKALNLGIYEADLSYAIIYGQNTDAMMYLQASRQLMDELNISCTLDRSFTGLIGTDHDNKNAAIKLLSDSFYGMHGSLNEHNRDDLSLLVMTGNWIEVMYLTSQIAVKARGNTRMSDIIMHHEEPLGIILSMMEDKGIINPLYTKLADIHAIIEKQQSPVSGSTLDTLAEMIDNLRTDLIK